MMTTLPDDVRKMTLPWSLCRCCHSFLCFVVVVVVVAVVADIIIPTVHLRLDDCPTTTTRLSSLSWFLSSLSLPLAAVAIVVVVVVTVAADVGTLR